MLTLICLATTNGIDAGMDFNASSPQHNGSYSGCTKKITKIESPKHSSISTSYTILELSIIATLIVLYILPILVVLPMGGGNSEKKQSPHHSTSGSDQLKTGNSTIKGTRRASNTDEHDKIPNKRPRNVGRPQKFENHSCSCCTIWIQSGSHPSLQAHHLCIKMRHPGTKFQDMSEYASHGGITITLYPESCICQQCYTDYQRKPTVPRWYKKYEELISETGEALDLGAEVETYGEIEGASGDQDMDIPNSVDTNTDSDTTDNYTQDSDTHVTEGTEHHQIKLIIDHALSNLTQDGCIYSKD